MPKRISNKRKEMGEESWAEYQAQKNRDKSKRHAKSAATRASNSRRLRKRKLIDYKGGKCERCGLISEINGIYVFHHRDPSQKEFGLSKNGTNLSLEKCMKEVDKCDLLCHNCHAIIHWEWDQEKQKHSKIP